MNHPLHSIGRIVVAAASLSLGIAAAQNTANPPPSPKDDPELNAPPKVKQPPAPPAAADPKAIDPTPAKQPQDTAPTVPAPQAGVGAEAPPITPAKFHPEGTFISDRSGTIFATERGDVIFIPLGSSAATSNPVVLLPCQKLEQMLAAKATNGERTQFTVAGQVFTYRDREYVLPTIFAARNPDAGQATPSAGTAPGKTKATDAAPSPASAPVPSTTTPADSDPRVTDLIRDLEQSRTGPRRVSPAPSAPAVVTPAAPVAPAQVATADVVKTGPLSNEGSLLTSRRGRLVRLANEGGRLGFVIDNDPNSPGAAPMILQPCRVMQQMESLSAMRGDAMSFRVSGRVMVYAGKNYLLPTFFQLPPKTDIAPRQ